MTKKHFIDLADDVRGFLKYQESLSDTHKEAFLQFLCRFCAAQNPRFNKERWLGYIRGECGKNGGKVK